MPSAGRAPWTRRSRRSNAQTRRGASASRCPPVPPSTPGPPAGTWVAAHRPAPFVAPVPVVTVVAKVEVPVRRAAPAIQWKLEDDEEEVAESVDAAWEGPVRLDVWAAASAGVVALGVMLIALM